MSRRGSSVRTGGRALRIAVGGDVVVDVTLAEAERAWADAIQKFLQASGVTATGCIGSAEFVTAGRAGINAR